MTFLSPHSPLLIHQNRNCSSLCAPFFSSTCPAGTGTSVGTLYSLLHSRCMVQVLCARCSSDAFWEPLPVGKGRQQLFSSSSNFRFFLTRLCSVRVSDTLCTSIPQREDGDLACENDRTLAPWIQQGGCFCEPMVRYSTRLWVGCHLFVFGLLCHQSYCSS